ncbi:MAG: hypothetical protein AAFU79_21450, partial [Myxococcota bacterium]
FLEDTAELRAHLREETLREDLAAAIFAIPKRLRLIWTDAGLSPRQKRRLLFEIWDGALLGEGARGKAGAKVKAIVMDFLDRYLDEPHERYTERELAELERIRSSSVAFAPPRR